MKINIQASFPPLISTETLCHTSSAFTLHNLTTEEQLLIRALIQEVRSPETTTPVCVHLIKESPLNEKNICSIRTVYSITMTAFSDLPIEILQDNILPFLPPQELLHLTCTNTFFFSLCSDEAVWKRKLLADFNYTGEETARTVGWKVIYRGLHKPKVYVWGEPGNGRLGVVDLPKSSTYGVPFPFQLKLPGVRIVSLAAGGMSFHALDSDGFIHVWGTLDGTNFALPSDGFAEPGKRANTPHKLLMPSPIRSISCGRLHASALDYRNKIWTFVSWGRPFYIDSPAFQNPLSPPVQVECGWGFSAALTASGNVFVWWPTQGPLARIIQEKNDALDSEPDQTAVANADQEIPCVTFGIDSLNLTGLPSIPELPVLKKTGVEEESDTKLIHIAGLVNCIIGITNHGHVLKIGINESLSNRNWDYLPKFSDVDLIRQHKVFKKNGGREPVVAPDVMKITHVTGNFEHFIVYSTGSSSLVLVGHNKTTAQSLPDIKPELQNRSVISVAIGDWHNAALTADGKVLTWGEFSSGALGLGDPGKLARGTPGGYASGHGRGQARPPRVTTPTQVRFDYGVKKPRDLFAFAITAAGWHTGALVMDRNPGPDEDDVYEME